MVIEIWLIYPLKMVDLSIVMLVIFSYSCLTNLGTNVLQISWFRNQLPERANGLGIGTSRATPCRGTAQRLELMLVKGVSKMTINLIWTYSEPPKSQKTCSLLKCANELNQICMLYFNWKDGSSLPQTCLRVAFARSIQTGQTKGTYPPSGRKLGINNYDLTWLTDLLDLTWLNHQTWGFTFYRKWMNLSPMKNCDFP